jgi:hypothetical protein
MATIVQAPTFAADPNAVPATDPFGNVMRGYQLSQLPAKLKAERQQAQANLQKTQQENAYYPKMQDSALALQAAQTQGKQLENQYYPQLTGAQIAQLQAQTGLTGQQSSWYGRLTQSEIAKNQAEAAKAGQADNGIIMYDANGNPIVQIGGSGGSGARNGGRLGTDANGNVVSELTSSNKTAVQNRKIGEDVVKPFIDQIVANVPQFQTAGKRAQSAVSGVFNQAGLADWQDNNPITQLVGLNSNLPSQQATGQSAIINSTEGLVKALGLRPTDQQTAMIQKALAPQPGESEKGYRTRVLSFAQTLSDNTNNAQKMLATGINTGVQQAPYGNVTNAIPAPQQQPPAPNPQLSQITDEQLAQIANGGQ